MTKPIPSKPSDEAAAEIRIVQAGKMRILMHLKGGADPVQDAIDEADAARRGTITRQWRLTRAQFEINAIDARIATLQSFKT